MIGFGKGELVAVFGRGRRRGIEFGQGFQAALCLFGFAGFGAKAVDKALQMGALAFAFGVFGVLLQAFFMAQAFKGAVVAAPDAKLAALDVPDVLAQAV